MKLLVIDEMIRLGREVNMRCKQIGQQDKELASQIRRAWVRAIMNAGEAQHRRGAKRCNRFDDAMGEAREAFTGLRAACGFELIEDDARTAELMRCVDGVVATLYVLAHRPRH